MQERTLDMLMARLDRVRPHTGIEVLAEAARIIQTRGWSKSGSDPNGGVCVVQALCLAASGTTAPPPPGRDSEAFNEAFWRLGWALDPQYRQSVFDWNDQPETELQHVLDMLERAKSANFPGTAVRS